MAYQLTHYRQYRTRASLFERWRMPALLAAATLGAAYLYVHNKTRAVERDNPPEGRFVVVDGVRLHYVERGQGPPLVLLHGNGVLAQDFDASGLLERAAERYRVIVFDRPGYGYSERPRSTVWTPAAQARLLKQALDRIGVEHPIVLGHSWGTLVALSMALQCPEAVRALVLLSGYYYPSLRLDAPLAAPPAIPIIGDLLRYTVAPLLGRLMWPAIKRRMFGPAPVPDRFQRLPVWMLLRPSQLRASAAESALMIPSAMMLSDHYPELTMPVLILAGSEDRIADVAHNAERLHVAVPHSSLSVERGVGHMIHYAKVEDILHAIDTLQGAPPGPVQPNLQPAQEETQEVRART